MSETTRIIVTVDYINAGNPVQEIELCICKDSGTLMAQRELKFDKGEVISFRVFIDKEQVHTEVEYKPKSSQED